MEKHNPTKKKLGIIGGMGTHAGLWLFNRITQLSNARRDMESLTDQDYLDIVLHSNSSIPDRTRSIVYGEASPLPELERSVSILNNAGTDVAVIACMTAHHYYEKLAPRFEGRLLSAVELVIGQLSLNPEYAGIRKIGLMGTTGTLTSRVFHDQLEPLGYEVITLDSDEQDEYFMKPIYMKGGIKSGTWTEEVKNTFCCQIPILAKKGAEIIVGACSEIPLVVKGKLSIPFIDAFELLALQAVNHCYDTYMQEPTDLLN